jgi:hypothetical protein
MIFIIIILIIIFYFILLKLEVFQDKNTYKIYYINLKHRKDRKKHIKNQLQNCKVDPNQTHCILAIKKVIGSYGCMLSHIKALEKAMKDGVDYAVILEDDFVFKHTLEFDKLFDDLKQLDWDVCLLSGNHFKLNTKVQKNIYSVSGSQTTSGYIIRKSYIPILLDFWKQQDLGENKNIDYSELNKMDCSKQKNCPYTQPIDESWKRLQERDKWIIIYPTIGEQIESYSDILNKFVNYKEYT